MKGKTKQKNRPFLRGPKKRGSLTVLATLSLMLVAQLLFTLAEAGRQQELQKVADMVTDASAEALMADYNRPMWETYHLLCVDAGGSDSGVSTTRMTETLKSLAAADFALDDEGGGKSYTSLLRLAAGDVCFDSYTLLTDGDGEAYINQVAEYMKDNLTYEAARKVYNNYDAIKSLQGSSDNSTTNTVPSGSSGSEAGDEAGNTVMDLADSARKTGILTLTLSDSDKLSGKSFEMSKLVSHRNLAWGLSPVTESNGWYETVLLQQYLLAYLQDYTDAAASDDASGTNAGTAEEHALSYELEYLIAGKAKDQENLSAVLTELLAIREVTNLLYLSTSSTRGGEADALAAAISSITGEIAEKPVKAAILAAWAYGESLMDLRALLTGRKIPLLKSDASWSCSLSQLPAALSGQIRSQNCDTGLSYQDYLGILLFSKSADTLAMRAMDLQEAGIRQRKGYESFRMDHCINRISFSMSYSYEPIFLSFVSLLHTSGETFQLQSKSSYSYLENLKKKGG